MTLHSGDCLDVMAGMDPESVDAVVTDPPYDLTDTTALRLGAGRERSGLTPKGRTSSRRGFMGKAWDGTGIAFRPETWEAAFRVAKPSAYLLAFGGTRTVHRLASAIEDAGWIIRDMLVWAYASGFPKSKASLKPAWEPIVMARKPGPLRMLAIDECRIGVDHLTQHGRNGDAYGFTSPEPAGRAWFGRWPANVLLTDELFEPGVDGVVMAGSLTGHPGAFAALPGERRDVDGLGYSRFFLIPKANRADREPVFINGQTEGAAGWRQAAPSEGPDGIVPGGPPVGTYETRPTRDRLNVHPTVKPTDLMRHLVRLVTPAGGTVLDPFLGSGTTAIACELEDFPWIGIEREAEYVAIAEARLNGTQRGIGLAV